MLIGRYAPGAVRDYLGVVDSMFVDRIHAHGVVTYERHENGTKWIKIPNAAAVVGVSAIEVCAMLSVRVPSSCCAAP